MSQHLTRVIFLRFFAAALLLAASASCYEDTVSEKLILDFKSDGRVDLTAIIEIVPETDFHSPGQRARMDAVRAELADERDPWSRRFRAVDPLNERRSWEKEARRFKRVEHSGLIHQSNLAQFFADCALTFSILDGEGWRELAIYPGTSSRATNQQRAQVQTQLEQWSRFVATYLSYLERLYLYVNQHPSRAESLVGSVLEELIAEDQKEQLGELTRSEEKLVGDVRDAMGAILDALVASDKEPYSLDELSSLAFDPLPAELSIRLPGPVLEMEGMEETGDDTVRIRPLRLWHALESLQELWITPDPLVAWVNAARVEQEPIDLAAFLARERRIINVPTAITVRAAVEQRLVRRPVYRVRWRA